MLNSPILKDMSVDDLNQRYLGTYILYGQRPFQCNGFRKSASRGVRVEIILARADDIIGEEALSKYQPFDWSKLDTSRPLPGYYVLNMFPAFVTYHTNRQYQRGLTMNNTSIRYLNGYGVHGGSFRELLLQHASAVVRKLPKKLTKTITEDIKQTNYSILSRQLVIWKTRIFLNLLHIGLFQNNTFYLERNIFEQEIRDAVLDPIFYDPATRSTTKSNKTLDVMKSKNFFKEVADFRDPNFDVWIDEAVGENEGNF